MASISGFGESVSGRPQEIKRLGWLRRLALASIISVFGLIVLGGVVRVTGSGLGCAGEWPLCDGSIIPPLTQADIIEYSHRLVASAIVGPLILITGIISWIGYRRKRALVIPATVAVIMLLAQGGLGGVTVLTKLPGPIVAAHFGLAQALLACLILILVATYRINASNPASLPGSAPAPPGGATGLDRDPARKAPRKPSRFPRMAALAAIATYLLLLSGSYVTATPGALAACPDWPLCQGLSLPTDHLPAIHMLHRAAAAAAGALILYTLYRGFQYRGFQDGRRQPFFTASGVIMNLSLAGGVTFLLQLLVGAVVIWTNFPAELRALHLALATAVWGIMVALALVSRGLAEPTPVSSDSPA